MSVPKIVVTSATGAFGSSILKYLLSLVPPSSLTVCVRNPANLPPALTPPGVTVVRGDYTDPASLDAAFAGASRLLLISYPDLSRDIPFAAHKNAIDAAVRAGVQHVWYTSLAVNAVVDENVASVMSAHLVTEPYLKQSGLTYTILREGFWPEIYSFYLAWSPAQATNDIYIPADGPVSWVARDELAEATARLVAEGAHPNETLTLTGPAAHTLSDIVHTLGTLLSRPLTLHTIPPSEWVARNASDAPDANWRQKRAFLELWATTHQGFAAGEAALVTRTMEEVLGRAPKTLDVVLREMLQPAAGDSAK